MGDIVGWSDTRYLAANSFQVAQHAFLYNNGVMSDLGAIAGPEYYSAARSVNDSHEIVGSTNTISSVDGSVLSQGPARTNCTK